MKIVIINKSDARGGAAVVSRRLMHALQGQGAEVDMLVAEKLTDDPHVHRAASRGTVRRKFLLERLPLFIANGGSKRDLFKIDPATKGLPLWRHPLVKGADIVCLGWVNQGMLSLEGVRRIASRKPTVWIMHDMWNATGICHHAGHCEGFKHKCGNCPLLNGMRSTHDLSRTVWKAKKALYSEVDITFVAVSNWLKQRCRESSLMHDARIEVIGNPVALPTHKHTPRSNGNTIEMLMVAARLDDHIKGFSVLVEALQVLEQEHPEIHKRLRINLLGDIRDRSKLTSLNIPYEAIGSVAECLIEPFYRKADILVSPSSYETLPGTLVEAHLYGTLPVAFDSGGQRDIVTPGQTGILVERVRDHHQRAVDFAGAIVSAVELLESGSRRALARKMYESVSERFGEQKIARRYLDLFENLLNEKK